ncbi:MAG: beta-CASP ribonuclease aCPSF1, partial [Candidatus Bathyarchaeia archaeon]
MTGTDKEKIEVSQTVLQQIPKQAEVTRIEFEGPALAIYVKKPEVLISQSSIISEIVASIRKRIVIRSDPSVRLPEPEAMRIIKEEVSKEAEITSINFDPS